MSNVKKDAGDLEGVPPSEAAAVRQFEPLVQRAARRYAQVDSNFFKDLCQVGRMAVVDARRRFDSSHGVGFPYFAQLKVFREVKAAADVEYRAARRTWEANPSDAGVEEASGQGAGSDPKDTKAGGGAEGFALPILTADDASIGDHDSGHPVSDEIGVGTVDSGINAVVCSRVIAWINALDALPQAVVTRHLVEGYSQREVAEAFGCTQQFIAKMLRKVQQEAEALVR